MTAPVKHKFKLKPLFCLTIVISVYTLTFHFPLENVKSNSGELHIMSTNIGLYSILQKKDQRFLTVKNVNGKFISGNYFSFIPYKRTLTTILCGYRAQWANIKIPIKEQNENTKTISQF